MSFIAHFWVHCMCCFSIDADEGRERGLDLYYIFVQLVFTHASSVFVTADSLFSMNVILLVISRY